MLIATIKEKNKSLAYKAFTKEFYKKKSIVLLKSTKKSKFLIILKTYSQLRTKVSYKNSINNNNKDIIKLINNKTLNNLIELSTFFENTRHKSFIDKRISIET